MAAIQRLIADALNTFINDTIAALPTLLTGAIFLVCAFIVISVIRAILRRVLDRLYPDEDRLIGDFALLVATIAMWFAAALALLAVLGLEALAASFGTATGFLALGVSYALSDVIADAVAGIYLLRDPDFNEGDTVTAAGETGIVRTIGLRKSRLELEDDDVLVLGNASVESRWRRDVT
ncbi:MAG: mechanosensitive ion channel domain-containing protein [Salinirussus sp.]